MRKYLLTTILLLFCSNVAAAFDRSQCEKKTFVVTAYYSPLDNQAFYYKDSVTAEKILNGQGIAGASGKEVFNGMLAAPSTYDFGGKIYFPDMGVGEIADRGGAIVSAGNRGYAHDRIDIRMGHGEEGLVRALTFGKQTKVGYYCHSTTTNIGAVDVGLDFATVPLFKNFFDIALRIQELHPGRRDIRSFTLQKYLIKLGYLDRQSPTGFYGPETTDALCRYQIAKDIISAHHLDCGVFGKRTRYVMKQDVQRLGLLPSDLWQHSSIDHIIHQAVAREGGQVAVNHIEIIEEETIDPANDLVIREKHSYDDVSFRFYRSYTKGEQSSEVKILQTILQREKLYVGDMHGIYDNTTIDALFDLQVREGVLAADAPISLRGYLGPSTRKMINMLIN